MTGLSPQQKEDLIVSVGTHRASRRLQPVDIALLIQKSLSAGDSLEEVSQQLSLSPRVLGKFVSLLRLPSDVQMMIEWGSSSSTISFTAAAEIARLETAGEQRYLAEAIVKHQLSVPEVKQLVQIRKRSERSVREALEAALALRPVVETRHMIVGKIMSPELRRRLSEMTQQERDALLLAVLNQQGLGAPQHGARLGTDLLIVVCDGRYQKLLTSLSDDWEESLAQLLRQALAGKGQLQ